MSINYGLLKGSVTDAMPYQSGTDHYQIQVQGGSNSYRIAVDVYSVLAGTKVAYSATGQTTLDLDRMVMYYKDEQFVHPVTALLLNCADGFTAKAALDPAVCLDYIRYSPTLFPLDQMKVVPPKQEGNGVADNLNADIDPWVQKAKNNPDAEIYALGSGWDDNAPGARPDTRTFFGEAYHRSGHKKRGGDGSGATGVGGGSEGDGSGGTSATGGGVSGVGGGVESAGGSSALGIHDIHMNQGDSGSEAVNNGVFQDGALFIHFKSTDQWVAMFFKFQNQSINTDSQGNPVQAG